ncbi:hypothetical protein B0T16DRAFT_386560 [Cercophora newfieldiana]|uniref:Uncharacterized protein n=1 Tax=Cercophora newfieldiana TaxID=92897 RepID=A0AA40CVU1_9PEZI|nr:hypothetical protein B0T16DRAFT_386560 [Cercophora newfieldiana]
MAVAGNETTNPNRREERILLSAEELFQLMPSFQQWIETIHFEDKKITEYMKQVIFDEEKKKTYGDCLIYRALRLCASIVRKKKEEEKEEFEKWCTRTMQKGWKHWREK